MSEEVSMSTIRIANELDFKQTTHFALQNAKRRNLTNSDFWKLADDAKQQLERHHEFALKEGVLLVSQASDVLTGFALIWIYPAPLVYDLGDKLAGLIEDFFAPDIKTADELMNAALERIKIRNGCVAALDTPASWTDRHELASRFDLLPASEYWVKTNLEQHAKNAVRQATEADFSSIVEFNAHAQKRKQESNSRFWKIHPDAPARFEAWMRHSLTLADRSIFVAEDSRGFIVAQPTRLLPGHRTSDLIGCIDDFWSEDFGYSLEIHNDNYEIGTCLLQAAESDFYARGARTSLVITTSAWKSKNQLLKANGYHPAYFWSVKNLS